MPPCPLDRSAEGEDGRKQDAKKGEPRDPVGRFGPMTGRGIASLRLLELVPVTTGPVEQDTRESSFQACLQLWTIDFLSYLSVVNCLDAQS